MKTSNVSNQPDKHAPNKDTGHKDKPGEHKDADKSKSKDHETTKKPAK
ncbi:MAG: hypothetical protein H9917_02055 [Candidatus Oceanisphaera merdipullorum]|nr:hypothetical protein [Candidatus Oceanisphaera merdipullorum]